MVKSRISITEMSDDQPLVGERMSDDQPLVGERMSDDQPLVGGGMSDDQPLVGGMSDDHRCESFTVVNYLSFLTFYLTVALKARYEIAFFIIK